MTETVSTEAGLVERLAEAHDRFAEFEGVNNDDLCVVLEAADALRAAQEAQPVSFQWRNIDGWVECSIHGSAEQRQAYAKSMAAQIGLGYRELYATPVSPAPVSVGEEDGDIRIAAWLREQASLAEATKDFTRSNNLNLAAKYVEELEVAALLDAGRAALDEERR